MILPARALYCNNIPVLIVAEKPAVIIYHNLITGQTRRYDYRAHFKDIRRLTRYEKLKYKKLLKSS